ncbi:MAG: glycosyltransferase family 4 protein [Deltaproteobacteria bacterium]|nr:glycosyltransferase family 4 protein [Deltaproteobacteria bacterium]
MPTRYSQDAVKQEDPTPDNRATRRPRVAFVVQRCGLEVNGGAELLCLKIAQKMAKYWHTEVLTTTALDYMTWANCYPPGEELIGETRVRRFPVASPRNVNSFNRLSERIAPRVKNATIEEQEKWMRAQGPWSPALLDYVRQHAAEFDAFIFFPYLYATTYFTLPLVQDKAYLAPLAHDEWPIYMSMWDKFFQLPQGFIFNSLEELDFLKTRFPGARLNGPVAGMALDPPETLDGDGFRSQFRINERFILYIGRIDPSKGCDDLFHNFMELQKHDQAPRKLVLLGKPAMDVPKHPDIISLGFVDEQTKWNALAACDFLVMPSPYESLSIVLLEAWWAGKAVLVNGKCRVLVGQCRRAQGGLWYSDPTEFMVAVKHLNEETRRQLGVQGQRFVKEAYTWPVVERKYSDLINPIPHKNVIQ